MKKKVAVTVSRHWKALLGFNLLVFLGAWGVILTSPKVWTASAQLILPSSNGGDLDADLGTLGSYRNNDPSFSTQVNPLKIQQEILTSDALLTQAWASDPERDQATKPRNYGGFFEVTPVEQTSILQLSVAGSSPEVATQRTSALLKAYQQRLDQLRSANNDARGKFSQKQLEEARRNLAKTQSALAQFKRSTGLVNSEEQTKGTLGTINQLEASQAEAAAQARSSQERAKTLSARLRLSPDQAVQSVGLDQNEDYKYLRNQLAQVEATLAKQRSTFTNNNPVVQRTLDERAKLRQQIERYVGQVSGGQVKGDPSITSGAEGRGELIQALVLAESEARGQRQQAAQLQQKIQTLRNSLTALPAQQARLGELQRQAEVAEGVYKGLVAQVQQSNIDAFGAYPNVQVLNAPSVDAKPSSPKRSLVAINATLAAIVGSIALILLLESRNPLLTPKDLQSFKFSVVGRIPRDKQLSDRLNSQSDRGLSQDLDVSGASEVPFQRLASAISLQPLRDRRILITSAVMGEGKTTVTLQLAEALADLGFRVLMVDADFRKADLSGRLGCMRDFATDRQIVQVEPNLDLAPTQPKLGKKVVDILKRGRFQQYLAAAEANHDYDYVLIDSSPASSTSETALIAAVVPNVLFTVYPGVSARNAVNESIEQLTQHNATIIGLVINGVETQSSSYSYRSTGAVFDRDRSIRRES
ncbi:MAG: AAA family ATPase [Myxacorys californica WJT36-NPBG1]|jgi:uncharacterized protein involved in exopolysaccharide biosynthesis/Mrp family chromosome partitioning ATPase|nr:AAA family ATPase [Myxacorys californica WJT36-NPBG1]